MVAAEVFTDPKVFRATLLVDTDAGPRRLASIMDPWQRKDFEALDGGWLRACGQPADGGYSRAYLERPRGHAKTMGQAVQSSFGLVSARGQISGVAAAADADQARLLRDAIARLVGLNPWLASLLDVQRNVVRNIKTGSTLEIISSDAATSFGLLPNFVICDEIVHWRSRELWDSLLSSAAKRSRALICIISNAGLGKGSSWQWDLREKVRDDPEWYFNSLPGCCASWISPKALAEQRRLLPAIAFDRLWENRWSSGAGDALSAADLEACVTADGPTASAQPGWVYVGGLDLSASRDHSALVVLGRHVGHIERRPIRRPERREPSMIEAMRDCGVLDPLPIEPDFESVPHPGTHRFRVCEVKAWQPAPGQRICFADVEEAVVDAHSRYRLASLVADPWGAEQMVQSLQRKGVPAQLLPWAPANILAATGTLLQAVAERTLELFPHRALLDELAAASVEEKSYGCRLTWQRTAAGGHGDRANALMAALLVAKRFHHPPEADRPILGWPMTAADVPTDISFV